MLRGQQLGRWSWRPWSSRPISPTNSSAESSTRSLPQLHLAGLGRALTGVVACVGLASYFLGYSFLSSSTDWARFNAPAVDLRSPIPATDLVLLHEPGHRIASDDVVVTVSNRLTDRSTLAGLETRIVELRASEQRLRMSIDTMTSHLALLRRHDQAHTISSGEQFVSSEVSRTYLEMEASIAQQRLELTEVECVLQRVETEMAQEQERVSSLNACTLKTPVGGVVWRSSPSSGGVQPGETVAQVIVPEKAFVEAWIQQWRTTGMRPGDRATIRDRSGRSYPATVRRVSAAQSSSTGAEHALDEPAPEGAVLVVLDLKSPEQLPLDCIGEDCRVTFNGGLDSWLASFLW